MKNEEIADHLTSTLGGEEGWWSSSAEERVASIAFELLERGFDPEDARVLLQELISAVRSEYQ